MVKGIRHFGILTGCLKESIKFYDSLGFYCIDKRFEDSPIYKEYIQTVKMKHSKSGDIIELVGIKEEPGLPDYCKLSWCHLALNVSCIDDYKDAVGDDINRHAENAHQPQGHGRSPTDHA